MFRFLNMSMGEEHDAKTLFGGTLLKEYQIDKDTGEVEEIY